MVTDILRTFMEAFNAYENQQLKSNFREMSQGHNILVLVNQQHDNDINQRKERLKSVVDVINLKDEYNPKLLQLYKSQNNYIFLKTG
jgi:hypothetical protein